MKKHVILFLSVALLFSLSNSAFSQDAKPKKVQKGWENYKEQYETDYALDFEVVWNSVLKSIQDIGCQTITKSTRAGDDGLYKGIVHSDFCVFAMGDTTFTVLNQYSLDMPFVRGGTWDNGRLQYKFIIKEMEAGKVHVTMKTEMSGMESGVAKKVLFWRSNGLLELRMLDLVNSNMGKEALEN